MLQTREEVAAHGHSMGAMGSASEGLHGDGKRLQGHVQRMGEEMGKSTCPCISGRCPCKCNRASSDPWLPMTSAPAPAAAGPEHFAPSPANGNNPFELGGGDKGKAHGDSGGGMPSRSLPGGDGGSGGPGGGGGGPGDRRPLIGGKRLGSTVRSQTHPLEPPVRGEDGPRTALSV